MPPARMLLGAALALLLAWPVRGGEAVLFQSTVQTEGAEVRGKPGTKPAIYVTQKLKRGEIVQVVEKSADGWLKIVPPAGSYSWINTSMLRRADGSQGVWLVAAEQGPVPVLVGSPFKSGKPDVVGRTLERSAQVVAVGEPQASEAGDGIWLPIMPPPGEYRYIRGNDVADVAASSGAATTTTAAHPGATGVSPQDLPPPAHDVHVGGPAAATDVDPLLLQAEQLERSGDRPGAARLYDQLGNKHFNTNHDAAVQYYTRAAWLRGASAPTAPRPANEAEALYLQARQYEQAGKRAEASDVYKRLGDLYRDSDYKLSMTYYNRSSWLRQGQPSAPAVPAGGSSPGPPQSGDAPSRAMSVQMLGPGRLARSTIWIDGRATYSLESPQAQVLAYLAPQPGVDLERYVGQNVEVLGQVVSRNELRGQFMSVAKVRPMSAP